jgi:hypothetical protein
VYGKSLNYTTSFNNGIFTLDSNFYEDILHYDGVNLNNGTGDLVLLIELDKIKGDHSMLKAYTKKKK